MKKFISTLMAIIMLVSVLSVPTTTQAATANKFKTSKNGVLCVKGKYIFATQKGIYVSKKISGKAKRIVSKKSSAPIKTREGEYVSDLISDGKTIYFTVRKISNKEGCEGCKVYKYIIYSVKTSGKNLRKIKTIDIVGHDGAYVDPDGTYTDTVLGFNELKLAAYYKGCIYYCTRYTNTVTYASHLYKINVSNKKITRIKYGISDAFLFNGSIFCTKHVTDVSPAELYKINPKTNKIKKYKDDASFAVYTHPYFVTRKIDETLSPYTVEWKNIYTSTNGKTFKKSKKLPFPTNYVRYASGLTKYAILGNYGDDTLYKFTLKTGKKKKITGLQSYEYKDYKIKVDIRNDKPYFVYQKDDTIRVQRLSGSKAVNCKINKNDSISSYGVDYCQIANGYLVVNKKGTIYTYKLK